MLRSITLALVALCALPAFVRADGNIAQDAGPFEFTIGGSGSNDKSFNNGGFNLNGSLGWYATPNVELSLRDQFGYNDFGTGHEYTNQVKAAADFNFNFDRFQPFVGANIGYISGTFVNDGGTAAPEAGLKFYLTNQAFLYGMVEYDFFWNSGGNTTFNNGQFNYLLGLGLRF